MCIRISLWQAQESQFDGSEPYNSKQNSNQSCGPEDNEYSSQQLKPKPRSMAVNLESLSARKNTCYCMYMYTIPPPLCMCLLAGQGA